MEFPTNIIIPFWTIKIKKYSDKKITGLVPVVEKNLIKSYLFDIYYPAFLFSLRIE